MISRIFAAEILATALFLRVTQPTLALAKTVAELALNQHACIVCGRASAVGWGLAAAPPRPHPTNGVNDEGGGEDHNDGGRDRVRRRQG
jgi:hypothetical protein